MIDLPPPSYEQTVKAIARCDIPRGNIRIKYEDELQSDEITISDLGPVTEDKLRCLKQAVHPFYILTLTQEAQRTAFYDYSEREDRPKRRAEALAWLGKRGLADVPIFHANEPAGAVIGKLERFCSIKPGTALELAAPGLISFRREYLTIPPQSSFECLMNVMTVVDLTETGLWFGFIGNEALAEEKK